MHIGFQTCQQRHNLNILQTNMSDEPGIRSTWESLRAAHPGLPPELRAPQIDALYWLSERKHVILCVGTGAYHLLTFFFISKLDFGFK